MSVSEEERHELYLELERTHGREKATTLMSLLPPVGWADVATRQDLERLETRMDARFTSIDARFTGIDGKFVGIDAKFAGINAEFATVRAEMRSLIADVRMDIADSRVAQRGQLLLLFVALVGLQLSGVGIALALRQIL